MKASLRGVPAAPGVAHARIWRLPERAGADGSRGPEIGLDQAAEQAAAELESLQQRLRTGTERRLGAKEAVRGDG